MDTKPMCMIVLACVTMAGAAFGQVRPDAGEVLRLVAQKYADVKQLHLAFSLEIIEKRTSDGAIVEEITNATDILMEKPNKIRFQVTAESPLTLTSDGENAWIYNPNDNEYQKLNPAVTSDELSDADVDLDKDLDNAVAYYLQLAEKAVRFFAVRPVKKSRMVGEETIKSGETEVDCYIIEIADWPHNGVITHWWVAKKRHVVLREDTTRSETRFQTSTTSTILFSVVRINEPIDHTLFQFTPPPDARLLEKSDK